MVMSVLQGESKILFVVSHVIAALLFLITSSPGISFAEAKSFQTFDIEQRVACQTTLEDIRWSHRTWPSVNKQSKPLRSEVISDQQIRNKVENSLRMEAALAGIYGIEITNGMLQAELNRMARNTKLPERLQELFSALANNPVTIGECLARPALVKKKLYNNYVWDNRYHGDLRTAAEKALTPRDDPNSLTESGGLESLIVLVRMDDDTDLEPYTAYDDESGEGFQRVELETDEFDREVARLFSDSLKQTDSLPAANIDVRETETAFVYEKVLSRVDDRMEVQTVIWEKIGFSEWWQTQSNAYQAIDWPRTSQSIAGVLLSQPLITGNTQDLELNALSKVIADTWAPPPVIPTPRFQHTAIWSGSEMIVWGGYGGSRFNTGGRYDPVLDSWTATTTTGAPTGRSSHTAIWNGSEMIVWGGDDRYTISNTGGRYNAALDSWTATTTTGAPTARSGHTAIWSGSEMIVWGGSASNTGGRYDPILDSWTATTTTGAPTGRSSHTAIWSGTEMIVWGGDYDDSRLNTGGRYDPILDIWTTTTTTGAPTARSGHTVIWSGSEMIVWGGRNNTSFNTGGRYDPVLDSWTATTTTGAPAGRSSHTAIWSGTEMIVWGGYDDHPADFNSGGRYNPADDSWTAITTTGAPTGRWGHSAIWSGSVMIVWGGDIGAGSFYLNTGGRYDPALDSWTATTTTGAPTGRRVHSAIWSGSEMIVWGGDVNYYYYLHTGGRYDPALDSWTATTTTGAPTGRYSHAIWNGREMIIWGGYGGTRLNTGGRYNPALDSWTATTTTGAPTARSAHTVIWSGTEMIVWGGYDGSRLNTGGRYDPALDSWIATTTTGAPTARSGHTVIWSGSEMIVWGGLNNTSFNTGGRYDPVLDSWTATTTTGAPAARSGHTVIWSGSEMIVWGGLNNTGGRYDPTLDSWTSTTITGAPTARSGHTVIWSGTEMIVWGGGDNHGSYFNTGGRYDPVLDSWTTTTTTGAPVGRSSHTAIWSGTEMIVWGGRGDGGYSDNNVGIYYRYSTYTVGGSVTGLAAGNTVVLQNNGDDALTINADGGFTFATALDDGSDYDVTVLTQPGSPNQTCTVSKGTGTISETDVTDVNITCVTNTYDIEVTVGANGTVTDENNMVTINPPGGTVTVDDETNQVFDVTPATHFYVDTVQADGVNVSLDVNNQYTFSRVTGPHTFDATFAEDDMFTLAVMLAGNGNGTVTSNPTGIDCDAEGGCVKHFYDGSVVTLTAEAVGNISTFTGWSAETGCVGTGTCVVTMDAHKSVTATFTLNTYTVTPFASSDGSIAPSTPQTINHGRTTSFTVTPGDGYTAFVGGTCGGTLVGDTYTTNAITADCAVITVFSDFIMYAVNATAGQHGTISPSGITYVDYGEIINFTLTADENYRIDKVSGCNGTLAGNIYTTGKISASCEVTASFTEDSFPWAVFLPAIFLPQ